MKNASSKDIGFHLNGIDFRIMENFKKSLVKE